MRLFRESDGLLTNDEADKSEDSFASSIFFSSLKEISDLFGGGRAILMRKCTYGL